MYTKWRNGMNDKEITDALKDLKNYAYNLGTDVEIVANYLLQDPRLPYWSGSSLKIQHHYGKGGLVIHTHETVGLCFNNATYFPQYDIDKTELFLAALFHDAGKLYDYAPVEMYKVDYSVWESTSHKRYIHHISRSALMWSEASKLSNEIWEKYHDKVLHAILAHHMSRDFGSPVAPKSRVAWLVTLCDNMSARMCDAESWDIIKKP